MKNRLYFCVILFGLVGIAAAQPGIPPVGDTYSLISGEHTPVIFSGSGEASSSASYTTQWLQIGYSPEAPAIDNNNIGRFNPEQFTMGLKLSIAEGGDSGLVSTARFELAYDTATAVYWVADSSNQIIGSGNYYRADYGVWTFEALSDTSRRYLYPLRVFQGGYIRLVFETTVADDVVVDWILTGEH